MAQAEIDVVRKIVRMACKSGGHVCVSPALPAELAARLGLRYDLNLEVRDFDVIFSVRVESPNHINIEDGGCRYTILALGLPHAAVPPPHRAVG